MSLDYELLIQTISYFKFSIIKYTQKIQNVTEFFNWMKAFDDSVTL